MRVVNMQTLSIKLDELGPSSPADMESVAAQLAAEWDEIVATLRRQGFNEEEARDEADRYMLAEYGVADLNF